MDDLKDFEARYSGLFSGKELTGLKILNQGEQYLSLASNLVAIDGAVEMQLGHERVCIGWKSDAQLIAMQEGNAQELGGEDASYYEIEESSNEMVRDLVGKQLERVEFEWDWYHELDDNLEPLEMRHFVPVGTTIYFSGGKTLQVAAIEFSLKEREIVNPLYNSQGNLVVSINKVLGITAPWEDEN